MPIINKTKRTAAIYNRGREVVKVYDHGTLAWQKSTSIPDYLCFTALESGTFTLTIPAAVTPTYLSYVEWSKDGRTWNHTDNTSEAVTIDVQVASGEKVYWRGSGIRMGTSASNTATTDSIFTATGNFEVSGNIMSLLYGNSFDGVTSLPIGSEYTFAGLFYNNKKLLSIADLSLPATALVKGCYASMFYGCSNMTGMLSSLPATSYPMSACYMMFRLCSNIDAVPSLTFVSGNGGYQFQYMFDRCTSLVDASAIVMSASDTYSFSAMFTGCSALAVTPVMSLSTLKTGCFNITFQGCTNLKYVKCLATDISATNCLNNWLQNVSATGTFIQAEGVEWPRGASGIPTGWLAYDEGEDIPNDYAACDYIHITKGSGMVADVLADKSTYGCELEYNFTQNELDAAANNNTYIPLMYYQKAVNTDPDFPKQINGQLYLRYGANWLGWQRNAGIYTNPTTGKKTTNSSALIMKRPAVTGWHYIRCAATTTDDNFICLFDDEISQTGINYYRLMNENPTDEPAEIYISCRSASAAYPIDNGGDMKYFKIIHPDGETIVADYVPCVRKSDNVAGFWDKVGLVFKSSFRTPFVAGYNQT